MGRNAFLQKLSLGWILLLPPFGLAGQAWTPPTDPLVHDPRAQAAFLAICYLFILWASETDRGYRALRASPMLVSLYRFALLAGVWANLLILFDRIQTLPIGPRFAPTVLAALPGWAFTLTLGFASNPRLQALQGTPARSRRPRLPLKVTLPVIAFMLVALGYWFGLEPPLTEAEFRAHWMNLLAFATVTGALLGFSRRPGRGGETAS